jgi:tetratricopeptide (TPR) repeat protein
LKYEVDRVLAKDIFSDRGAARHLKGDLDGALVDYDQAIKLAPRFGDAWFNRGAFWEAQGDLGRAEEEARQDFAQRLSLNERLKPSLERLIKAAGTVGAEAIGCAILLLAGGGRPAQWHSALPNLSKSMHRVGSSATTHLF